MKWFEPIIIVIAVSLVILPIIIHIVKKKNVTLKCECGELRSECTGNCSNCHNEKKDNTKPLVYVLKINGMRCGMCESHINSLIRREFSIKKVRSSCKKNTTIITANSLINIIKLKEEIKKLGYEVESVSLK